MDYWLFRGMLGSQKVFNWCAAVNNAAKRGLSAALKAEGLACYQVADMIALRRTGGSYQGKRDEQG
ncbi:hypothetical protein ACFFYR_08030 [Paraburkholderia dipogonis]|uniref:hypothetical protein n=1 Tax=Paraburkholderia dipogonis TaxID=1211383 RepID=UPI0035EC3E39